MSDLLPPNSTALERRLASVLSDLERVPIPVRSVLNPHTCHASLLPYLAWQCSVDRWDPAWPENVKRDVVASAFHIHRYKGTVAAIRRVVEPLGYLLEITHWYQMNPEGRRGTFALRVGVLDTGITDVMYAELVRLVNDAKPCSRHIVGLDLLGETRGQTFIAAAVYDGDVTTVYPYIPPETQCNGVAYAAIALDVIDTTTVYPE